MRVQIVLAFVFFSVSLLGAMFFLQRTLPTWDDRLARLDLAGDDLRNPAALGRVLRLSRLHGEALFEPDVGRLVKGAQWIYEPERFGIQLGHFITKDGQRRPMTSCALYSRVQVAFVAEGMAVSGEYPEMLVEGPCQLAEDGSHLQTLWVPIKELQKSNPNNRDFLAFETQTVRVNFQNMPDHWPKTWRLQSIRLFDPNGSRQDLVLAPEQIRKFVEQPVNWVWDKAMDATAF